MRYDNEHWKFLTWKNWKIDEELWKKDIIKLTI